MAERRMFTQKIIDSDAFLEMPCSAQALYFHLCMRADDDGFVNNPQKIRGFCGASQDDLKLLLVKRFVLGFENGLIVIKHWRMHNLLRKDRYRPTQYQEEIATLSLKDDGSYTEKTPEIEPPKTPEIEAPTGLATKWQPNGNQMATQYSIGKYSIVKDSIVQDSNIEVETLPEIATAGETATATATVIKEDFFLVDGVGKGVVKLTKKQYDDLLDKLGYDDLKKYIERLANYITLKNAHIKSHYDTILKWYLEDSNKPSETISMGVKYCSPDFDPVAYLERKMGIRT